MKTLIIIFLFPIILLGQTDCQKYARNPVLFVGLEDSWDSKAVIFPSVLFDGTMFKMWYSGFDGTNYRIGYATSPDGIIWDKADDVNPVLDIGEADSWDDEGVTNPCVLFEDGVFKMWYTGYDGTEYGVGYATSQDGIIWSKADSVNPILEKGSGDSFECGYVFRPKVVKYKDEYIMLYGGHNGAVHVDMGCAKSPDGITWTKKDSLNPVMTQNFRWEECQVGAGAILAVNECLNLWYFGGQNGYKIRSGYAVSKDGFIWEKYNKYLLNYGHHSEWDYKFASIGSVYFDGKTYHFWYDSYNYKKNIGAIGYATSPHVVGVEEEASLPSEYTLFQNYPNPFNPSTKINYSIPNQSYVTLKVFDVLGREVSLLVNKEQSVGNYEVEFNASNLTSGVYFYRIQAGDYAVTKKMIFMK